MKLVLHDTCLNLSVWSNEFKQSGMSLCEPTRSQNLLKRYESPRTKRTLHQNRLCLLVVKTLKCSVWLTRFETIPAAGIDANRLQVIGS